MTTGPMPRESGAQDVLRAVVERYQSFDFYSDTGEVAQRLGAAGSMHRITFSTLHQRPSFFRFTFFRPHPHAPLAHLLTEHTVGFDAAGGYDTVKRPDGTTAGRSPMSLETAIARAAGISGGAVHTIGRLLLPQLPGLCLADMPEALRGADAAIEGKSCYCITARIRDAEQTFWIEKNTFFLRRRITRSGHSESVEVRENIRIGAALPKSLFTA